MKECEIMYIDLRISAAKKFLNWEQNLENPKNVVEGLLEKIEELEMIVESLSDTVDELLDVAVPVMEKN